MKRNEQLDTRISNSELSIASQFTAQIGGIATAGVFAFNTVQANISDKVGFAGIAVGFAANTLGTLIGLERGSAIRRKRQRELAESMGVEPIGITEVEKVEGARNGTKAFGIATPFAMTTVATTVGAVIASKDMSDPIIHIPEQASSGMAVLVLATGFLASMNTVRAGETFDMPPLIHRALHLH